MDDGEDTGVDGIDAGVDGGMCSMMVLMVLRAGSWKLKKKTREWGVQSCETKR